MMFDDSEYTTTPRDGITRNTHTIRVCGGDKINAKYVNLYLSSTNEYTFDKKQTDRIFLCLNDDDARWLRDRFVERYPLAEETKSTVIDRKHTISLEKDDDDDMYDVFNDGNHVASFIDFDEALGYFQDLI